MRMRTVLAVVLTTMGLGVASAEDVYPDPEAIPQVRSFLGESGFGSLHPAAPSEGEQFGRLVGIWEASQKIRTQDGRWVDGAPALWTWKYALDGFATQDLWLHTEDHLPSYLASLERAYLLTGLRIFEASSGRWRIAWAANGGGKSPGADFGTLDGESVEGDLVLSGESPYGKQRIVFSEITPSSFKWSSSFSQDGEEWTEIMRVEARRRR